MTDHARKAAEQCSDRAQDCYAMPVDREQDIAGFEPIIAQAIADATSALRSRLAALEAEWRDVARLWLTKADAYRDAAAELKAAMENRE